MPTETKIVQPRPRYAATVTSDDGGTTAEVGSTGARDEVLIQRGKGRSVLHIPLAEWDGFVDLIAEIDDAVRTKIAVEAGAPTPEPSA